MSKTWDELRIEYQKVCEMSFKPTNIVKVSPGHIFDENKSVKWNKEQVEINNKKYYNEVERLCLEYTKSNDSVLEDIYTAIQEEMSCGISRKQAVHIWVYAYNMGHSGGVNEIFIQLENLMDFIETILINK